ncbi:hypothetical protein C6V83_00005 [Gordonia iterans]|uniref:Uncharacterized protein n=1 Tax=Gordonia iterans TaxID=1004901 RepID=A0A2S0KB25_9ACTN|nr:hypothetical protein [Gordonia iterans]AVL98901.1 hypothetical protein C6V83_00005 [Gordonia iterans]
MADELYDLKGIAELTGLSVGTVRVYFARSKDARKAGLTEVTPGSGEALPEPDYRIGQSPAWKLETLQPWLDARSS